MQSLGISVNSEHERVKLLLKCGKDESKNGNEKENESKRER